MSGSYNNTQHLHKVSPRWHVSNLSKTIDKGIVNPTQNVKWCSLFLGISCFLCSIGFYEYIATTYEYGRNYKNKDSMNPSNYSLWRLHESNLGNKYDYQVKCKPRFKMRTLGKWHLRSQNILLNKELNKSNVKYPIT